MQEEYRIPLDTICSFFVSEKINVNFVNCSKRPAFFARIWFGGYQTLHRLLGSGFMLLPTGHL